MIIYLAGAIAHREQLYKDFMKNRLYSYHYHRPGESFFKEFVFKMEHNATIEKRDISVFKKEEVPV